MSDEWEVFIAGDGQPGIRAVDWEARAERAEADAKWQKHRAEDWEAECHMVEARLAEAEKLLRRWASGQWSNLAAHQWAEDVLAFLAEKS